MRRLIFLLALLYATGLCAQSPEQSARLIELENTRFQAMIRRDTLTLQTLLTDDLVYIHSNGLTESKLQHLQAIATRSLSYNIMTREGEPAVRWLDSCTAIVNGLVRVSGLIGSDPFTIRIRYTAVYHRDGRKKPFQLASWQSTRIPE